MTSPAPLHLTADEKIAALSTLLKLIGERPAEHPYMATTIAAEVQQEIPADDIKAPREEVNAYFLILETLKSARESQRLDQLKKEMLSEARTRGEAVVSKAASYIKSKF